MVTKRILSVAHFKTASRHWMPLNTKLPKSQLFAKHFSRQRCINFNNVTDASVVSNDNVFTSIQESTSTAAQASSSDDSPYFEPIVYSNDEIITASPVRKP